MFGLRSARAAPPARARAGERRATFAAALAQFEEMVAAARAVSAASRPLPLYYALSQAGRALAAAHAAGPWRLRGHGLSCPGTSAKPLQVNVLRDRAQSASDREPGREQRVTDAFSGVADASGSDVFQEKASIGALWCSLPEVASLLPVDARRRWLGPLVLVPYEPEYPQLIDRERVRATVVGFNGHPRVLCEHLRTHYPTAASVELLQGLGVRSPMIEPTGFGTGVVVSFPALIPDMNGHIATLDRVASRGERFSARQLRPAVAGTMLSPLLTWWALLFGLSMLARYEPGNWTAALALDRSPLAAPLEECLRRATQRVPELVHEALLYGPNTASDDR